MKHYLPIGSVILLRGATKKIMITGYYTKHNEENYNYIGVPFPEGLQNSKSFILFRGADISSVFLVGLRDGEGMSFLDRINKAD